MFGGNVTNPDSIVGMMAKCEGCKGCKFSVGGNVFETPYDKVHCLMYPHDKGKMKPLGVRFNNEKCPYFEELKPSEGLNLNRRHSS